MYYQEDYVEFVKKNRQIVKRLENISKTEGRHKFSVELFEIMIELAENQVIISEYIAMEAGVNDEDI